jgi:acyl carrier protein
VESPDITAQVYALLGRHAPHAELSPGLPLGADGLALDSISFVELFLEIESAFSISIAEELLATESLTVGELVERVKTRVK